MKLQEILDKTIHFFKEKKYDSPRLDAELLLSSALGFRRIDLYLKFDQPVNDEDLQRCREAVRRRSRGEPVAYIMGQRDFYGLTFTVDRRVLIPRPETELLAEEAILYGQKLKLADGAMPPLEILDLGSGSGCLGLTLAHKIPEARVTLVDVSTDALQVARLNAEKLGLYERVQFIEGDAAQLLVDQQFDIVVANPPYIAPDDKNLSADVVKYEPRTALFADDEGLAMIRSWSQNIFRSLKPGAFIGFETGMDQGAKARAHFSQLGLESVRTIKDLAGLDRHVVGRKALQDKGKSNG
ncbi:MAG: peptide chain release factor N(5)-glutamine methyltransferase [Bdellovibrio sp.]|jgi:release factor glutamine methyltransferase